VYRVVNTKPERSESLVKTSKLGQTTRPRFSLYPRNGSNGCLRKRVAFTVGTAFKGLKVIELVL
jgi:hypothetical protein